MKRAAAMAAILLASVVSVFAAQAGTGTLRVQLVEPGWWPVPGVVVRVTKMNACSASARPVAAPVERTTDSMGHTSFENVGAGYYRLDVKKEGGFAAKRQCVRLFDFVPNIGTAYVQVRLGFAGPPISVHD